MKHIFAIVLLACSLAYGQEEEQQIAGLNSAWLASGIFNASHAISYSAAFTGTGTSVSVSSSGKSATPAFNGSSSRYDMTASAKLSPKAVTYCAWIRLSDTTANGYIMGTFDIAGNVGTAIKAETTLGFVFYHSDYYYEAFKVGQLVAGKWYFVAATRSSSMKVRMFIDANEYTPVKYLSSGAPDSIGVTPFSIGRLGAFNAGYFKGNIRNCFLFGRELSHAEIRYIYLSTMGEFL